MSELTFCKQFLSALDARPIKLSSDHIADARQYPPQGAYILPRLPHPPHPQRPTAPPSTSSQPAIDPSAAEPASKPTTHTTQQQQQPPITLKPLKPAFPIHTLPSSSVSSWTKTSIYDLKSAYSATTQIPVSKIKILFRKKPIGDSKTVAEVVGEDAEATKEGVEFGVMLVGVSAPPGAGAGGAESPPVTSPSAADVVMGEADKGLASGQAEGQAAPAAQGPSGREVVESKEFWEDLRGFVMQRIRDEKEGERLVGVFKEAWEKGR